MKKATLFLLVCLLAQTVLLAQYPVVDMPGTQTRNIHSAIVNQDYVLQVSLPANYEKKDKRYPVVYVMDSQWDFPLVRSIYGQQYYDGFIPEMIIVGVTWGGNKPNPDSLRGRDYTPTNEKRMIQSGGADAFLSFMKTELFPFVESNYKADSTNRTLVGCSLGGLFTIYTLLTHTDMFSGYAAASPAVGWDNQVLYQYEKTFAENKSNKPVRLYMTVGDVERGRPIFEKFSSQLMAQHYPNLSIHSRVLENTGHSGTKSETYTRGLQYIFERRIIKPEPFVLQREVGTYQSANGTRIELKEEDGHLVFYFSDNNKYDLLAENDSRFYSKSEFFNLHFVMSKDQVKEFELERYGGTQIFTPVK